MHLDFAMDQLPYGLRTSIDNCPLCLEWAAEMAAIMEVDDYEGAGFMD